MAKKNASLFKIVEELKNKLIGITDENIELSKIVDANSLKITSLNNSAAVLKSEKDSLIESIDELKHKSISTENKVSELVAEMAERDMMIRSHEIETNLLKGSIKTCKSEIENKQRNISDAAEKIYSLSKTVGELNDQEALTKNKIADLEMILDEKNEYC